MEKTQEIYRLKELAYEMRIKLLKFCGSYDGAVHIGGDLSMTEILIGLWHHALQGDPENLSWPERDRFIMSKGHGALAMYMAMSLRGFFDYEEIISTYGQLDSKYGMHPCRVQLPALECSSGSLGQGLAMANGIALNAKRKGEKYRVYCLMGDGETGEGSVWEAAMMSSSYKLGNVVGIVDRNCQTMTFYTEDKYMSMAPYKDKWKAFGWNVLEINGNDMAAVVEALDSLPAPTGDVPTMLVCNTVKGKGVSFMEHALGWHSGCLGTEDMERALLDVQKAWDKEKEEMGR